MVLCSAGSLVQRACVFGDEWWQQLARFPDRQIAGVCLPLSPHPSPYCHGTTRRRKGTIVVVLIYLPGTQRAAMALLLGWFAAWSGTLWLEPAALEFRIVRRQESGLN